MCSGKLICFTKEYAINAEKRSMKIARIEPFGKNNGFMVFLRKNLKRARFLKKGNYYFFLKLYSHLINYFHFAPYRYEATSESGFFY